MTYLFVGVGGILGSLTRVMLEQFLVKKRNRTIPFAIIAINITGAVLLGMLCGIGAPRSLYILAADGFLGAYTTFSAFMYESFNLFRENNRLNAIVYIICTVLFGIIGFAAGIGAGRIIHLML
ncbi:MAG: fluoride efflux transporter CrcB [Clostridia bacterium]|nr:fluoride efflux transporter CrcB [Clostridia bacterium]